MTEPTIIYSDMQQGSQEWLHHRMMFGGGSEAAAMLGLSKKVTRNELLRMKHTGLPKEFSTWLQENVLDRGHMVEALALPFAEAYIDDDLYPEIMSMGRMGASLDGATMRGRIIWECKQWRQDLVDAVLRGECPAEHMPQCQQNLMVSGADRLLFTVSDGTLPNTHHVWVEPDPAWFARLRAGWEQFWLDLESYELPPERAPKAVGNVREALPSLVVAVSGAVTKSNLEPWKASALHVIRSINTTLEEDQHFADAQEDVKFCELVESKCLAASEGILGQTESIDAALKAIAAVSEEARQRRLSLTKLVDKRKAEIKDGIIAGGRRAWEVFLYEKNKAISPYVLTGVTPNFIEAAKNKRTLDSLQNAVDTELARVKIEATDIANRVTGNMRMLAEFEEFSFLFKNATDIVFKDAESARAIASSRIVEHKVQEEIRKSKAEDAALERQRMAELMTSVTPVAGRSSHVAERSSEVSQWPASDTSTIGVRSANILGKIKVDAEEAATLNGGSISSNLGFRLDTEFITDTLGVPFRATNKNAKLWFPSDYDTIRENLIEHIRQACICPF